MHCGYWYHTKRQSLYFSDTNSGWWATSTSVWNLRSKWPTPFEKHRCRQISSYNVSIVRDSEKSSIMTNMKSTQAFKRAIDGARTSPLSPQKMAQKRFFSFKKIKVNFNWIKSTTKFLCVQNSSGKVVVQPFTYLMVHRY